MGKKLTLEAQKRLERAIAREFPERKHKDLYPKAGDHYNFSQLENLLRLRYCSITPPTLSNIFRRERGSHVSTLINLFTAINEPFDEDQDCIEAGNKTDTINAELISPKHRNELPHEFCNLPRLTYEEFIGRDQEIIKIMEFLAHDKRPYIFSIDGIGGVGKTTLTLEVAYLCWEKRHGISQFDYKVEVPLYEAIVWVSYRTIELNPVNGVIKLRSLSEIDYLEEIYAAISECLNCQDLQDELNPNDRRKIAYKCLAKQKTLIILDDLNFPEQGDKTGVFSFLNDLPEGSKAIITTRKRYAAPKNMRLDKLSEAEGIRLINQALSHRNYNINEINLDEKKKLYECLCGIPIALKYAITMYDMGYPIESILRSCPTREIAPYCFENIVKHLEFRDYSLPILEAASVFTFPPNYESTIYVANLENKPFIEIEDGLSELKRADLLSESNDRYIILSLTKEYVISETRKSKEKYDSLLERRFQWCMRFVEKYGGDDWGDWRDKYDYLNEEWGNIISILQWGSHEKEYSDIKKIWNRINHFSDLYGKTTERIHWLDWLIAQSDDRGDSETYILSMARKMWTLTMTGEEDNFIIAKKIMEEILEADVDKFLRDYLLHNSIVLLTRLGDIGKAESLLSEKKSVMAKISRNITGDIDLSLRRRQINTIRDEAKINLAKNEIDISRQQYSQVLQKSNEINWKRMACYAQNMLAEIAILDNRLDDAEKYLDNGTPTHIYNRNRRRRAFYTKTDAYLKEKCGKSDEARNLARLALDLFGEINMEKERKELIDDFNL